MSLTQQLTPPYLLFLGDTPTMVYAKTALGIVPWAPKACVAQLRFPGCPIDAGLPDMTIAEARAAGAKSLIIGSAPVGGGIEPPWLPTLMAAIAAGMDIVSGLHSKLSSHPQLREAAANYGTRPIDVRVPSGDIPMGVIWAGAMMLQHLSFNQTHDVILTAIETVLREGKNLTRDMRGEANTQALGQAVANAII